MPIVAVLDVFTCIFSTQKATRERTPNTHPESRVLDEWDDVMLDLPVEQGVVHLTRGKLGPTVSFLDLQRHGRLPSGPVGKAEIPHLSVTHQNIQCAEGLLERRV